VIDALAAPMTAGGFDTVFVWPDWSECEPRAVAWVVVASMAAALAWAMCTREGKQ